MVTFRAGILRFSLRKVVIYHVYHHISVPIFYIYVHKCYFRFSMSSCSKSIIILSMRMVNNASAMFGISLDVFGFLNIKYYFSIIIKFTLQYLLKISCMRIHLLPNYIKGGYIQIQIKYLISLFENRFDIHLSSLLDIYQKTTFSRCLIVIMRWISAP